MAMNRGLRETLELLAGLGYNAQVVSQNRHIKVQATHPAVPGQSLMVTVSRSESDWRGQKNTAARARRFLRQHGGVSEDA